MSLSVGDTFSFPNSYGVSQSVVDQISYVNGKKVIYFADDVYQYGVGIDETDRTTFIEGTFPNSFPLGFYDNYFLCFFYLLCESKDGEQVFDHPYFESCYISYYNVTEKSDSSTKIFPTSVYFTETIQVETSDPILDVFLYDLFGREVPANRFEETPCHWNLTVLNGASGMYIIKVTTKKGINYEKIYIHNQLITFQYNVDTVTNPQELRTWLRNAGDIASDSMYFLLEIQGTPSSRRRWFGAQAYTMYMIKIFSSIIITTHKEKV